jgi:DNA-binding CsgD family transcriptional regulator
VHGLLRRVLAGEHGTVHWEGQSAEEVLLTCLSPSPMGGWILRLEKRPLEVPFHFHALPEFSPRENEVLEWMVQGKRNAEIAAILEIAVGTVEKHVGAVLVKLGVENRAAAIVRAIERCGRL